MIILDPCSASPPIPPNPPPVRPRCRASPHTPLAADWTSIQSRLLTQPTRTCGRSLDPTKPGHVLKWLVLADRLQLDELRACCLEGLKAFPPAC